MPLPSAESLLPEADPGPTLLPGERVTHVWRPDLDDAARFAPGLVLLSDQRVLVRQADGTFRGFPLTATLQLHRHEHGGLTDLWFVGDSLGDLEAAKAVDSQPVLVKTGKGEKTLGKTLPVGTLIFDDLAAIAAELIHN